MKTERFFELLLDFGSDWCVREVESCDETNEVEIYLEYCGHDKPYDFAPPRRWRHLNTLQYQSFLHARLPRFQNESGQVQTLTPPWADKHERHTHLFECAVIDLLLATHNQSQTARLIGCPFDVVNRILHRSSARGMERRQELWQRTGGTEIKHLSVDEKSFQSGHHYATVLSDGEHERILDVVEHRTKEAVTTLLTGALSESQREQVETISMDMWAAFATVAEEQLPNAVIVHDKFHLIQYLNRAIDQVRRREVKLHEELRHSRYALLKNPENLTEKQRLKFEQIQATNLEVGRAWQARQNFQEIFTNITLAQSEAIYRQWHEWVMESGIKEVIKVAEMFASHLSGVLQAMTSRWNNARAERLNGKIQLLKATARGYRQFQNFRSAILFFHGKLNLYPLNSQ